MMVAASAQNKKKKGQKKEKLHAESGHVQTHNMHVNSHVAATTTSTIPSSPTSLDLQQKCSLFLFFYFFFFS
mgnify:CR=1 FL=1